MMSAMDSGSTARARTAISVAQAREIVLDAVPAPAAEPVALADAHGRVLSRDVSAAGDVPPFDNSAMDGFAVAAGPAGRRLAIIGESRAGAPARVALSSDGAIRISTGAQMPADADAVIELERVTEDGGSVLLQRDVDAGANVRRAGEDMRAGELVLRAGTRIGAPELAVAAAAGAARLECARRPRVIVVATGDELVEPGRPLGPGQIHETNALALTALARDAGAHASSLRPVGDSAAATVAALADALLEADAVVVAGGVSVGAHDHVKGALAQLGVRERFWRVALRPGRPTWFGTRDETLVFGLPGNPVSAIVTFLLFVRPALAALQGAAPGAARNTAILTAAVARNAGRDEAVRVTLEHVDGTLRASPTGPQGSHILTSLLAADALAIVAAGEGELEAGTAVPVELI